MTNSKRLLRPVFSYTLVVKSDLPERANKFVGPFETLRDAQEARIMYEEMKPHHTINIVAVEHPTDKRLINH
jgi:hypothetical protein